MQICKRTFSSLLSLFFLLSLSFFILRALPGGPFDDQQALPQETKEKLKKVYDLHLPLHQQYLLFLKNLSRGDFGPSLKYRDFSVRELILKGLPISLALALSSLLFSLFLGIPLGILSVLRKDRWETQILSFLFNMGIALPNYVLAPLLSLLFSLHLKWLPVAGWENGNWRYLILPICSLSLAQIAHISRFVHSNLLSTLQTPFVQAAIANGIPLPRILYSHCFKPVLLPLITYLTPTAASLVTHSVSIERIFCLPGLGTFLIYGVLNRDYPLVLGMIFVFGCFISLGNFLVDLLYSFLNPQISFMQSSSSH